MRFSFSSAQIFIATVVVVFVAGCATTSSRPNRWSVALSANDRGPGSVVDFKQGDQPIARFIYGQGQFKPFLHVYGEDGVLLTNPGLDDNGGRLGLFPHHRGIFIGWNKISSDLGTYDLWHFNNGGRMEVTGLDVLESGRDYAKLVATIDWRGGQVDASGSDRLLNEKRTFVVRRPVQGQTQIDATFLLTAVRPLNLGGDLQHAGVHFRAAAELAGRTNETSYLWEPRLDGEGGRVVSSELKWCQLLFPNGPQSWYTVLQLNAPTNPTEELSWRDYGRFGFFFKKSLAAGEVLELHYRFWVKKRDSLDAFSTPEKQAAARSICSQHYSQYATEFRK